MALMPYAPKYRVIEVQSRHDYRPWARVRGARDRNVALDSAALGTVWVSQQTLRERYQLAFESMRKSGNSRFGPKDIFQRNPRNQNETMAHHWVADWLMSRTQYTGYSAWGGGGASRNDKLLNLLDDLDEQVRTGTIQEIEPVVDDLLSIFEALGEAFSGRNALDAQLLKEIMNGALRLVPVLDDLAWSYDMFELVISISTMTDCEVTVIRDLLLAMTPTMRADMYTLALQQSNDLGTTITQLLDGYTGLYPSQQIRPVYYPMGKLSPRGRNHGRR